MTATPNTSHYHVIALQNWSGRYEYARGENQPITLTQARQHANDMIRANTIYMSGNSALETEFGDRFHNLISTNVNPSWNSIWIVGCGEPCRFQETFRGRTCPTCGHTAQPSAESWGEPY